MGKYGFRWKCPSSQQLAFVPKHSILFGFPILHIHWDIPVVLLFYLAFSLRYTNQHNIVKAYTVAISRELNSCSPPRSQHLVFSIMSGLLKSKPQNCSSSGQQRSLWSLAPLRSTAGWHTRYLCTSCIPICGSEKSLFIEPVQWPIHPQSLSVLKLKGCAWIW